MSEKQDKILEELKFVAKQLKYGELYIMFKVHEGEIVSGEIKKEVKKLG